VVGDHLVCTNEFAVNGHTCFAGNQLGAQESTAIVLEFLSRFPDESGSGVVSVPDIDKGTHLHKKSPMLSSLIELADVHASLLGQLRSRGIFCGFVELQQCRRRDWDRLDAQILQAVAGMFAVVVQRSLDQSKIEAEAREMKLICEITNLFRDTNGSSTTESVARSAKLFAEHAGFSHAQIYLYDPDKNLLTAQIRNGDDSSVEMSMKDNPFATVFESGRGKIVNAEFTRKEDSFFKHDMALLLPLTSQRERLGVIAWWQRLPNKPQFVPRDKELGLTISTITAQALHIEKLKS
jgi:hypothetical protein